MSIKAVPHSLPHPRLFNHQVYFPISSTPLNGWQSIFARLSEKVPQLHPLYGISIVELYVRLLCGLVFYLSPGSAALRPGHSSTQQEPSKPPAAAAEADLQQGRHSTVLWGMSSAPLGAWTEVRRSLKGTDGWTVCGQGFLWKAIQRILWQRLRQLITRPLILFPAV